MTDNDLTCQQLVELVSDYLEGALADDVQARFESHVADCAGCAAHLDQIRTTIALSGRVTVDDLSEQAKAGLLAAFRGWARRA